MNAPTSLVRKRSRRAALIRHGLWPLQNHPFLQRYVRLVQTAFKVPYAAVTMPADNDEDINIVSQAGGNAGITSIPRYKSLCSHAMLLDDLFIVEDMAQDWRFKDAPSATGQGFGAVQDGKMFRFYASVPVKLSLPAQDPRFPDEAINVGRLMIMDYTPRSLDNGDVHMLNDISHMVSESFDNAYREQLGQKTAKMAQSLGYLALSVDNPKLLRKFNKMPGSESGVTPSSTSETSDMDEMTASCERTQLVCASLRSTLNAQTAFAIDVRALNIDAPKPRPNKHSKKRRAAFPRASWSPYSSSPLHSPEIEHPATVATPKSPTPSTPVLTPGAEPEAELSSPLLATPTSERCSSPGSTALATPTSESPHLSHAYIPDTITYGPDLSRLKLGHGPAEEGEESHERARLHAYDGSEEHMPDVTSAEATREIKELLSLAQHSHNPDQAHFWANLEASAAKYPTDSEHEPSTTGSASGPSGISEGVSDSSDGSAEFSPLSAIVTKDTRMYATVPVLSASRTKIRKVLVITFTTLQALDQSDLLFLHAAANILHASITRREAIAAEQAQLSFIQTVQHELRTPLHGILGVAEDLRHALQSRALVTEAEKHCLTQSEYLDRSLEVIELAGSSLTRLLDDVLDFGQVTGVKSTSEPVSRPGLGDQTEVNETLDIADWMEKLGRKIYAYEKMMRRVKSGQLALSRARENRHMPELIIFLSDEVQKWSWVTRTTALTKVISRVVGNAFRFTESGEIELRCDAVEGEENEDQLLFTVSDTGKGMSQEFIKHQLFRPFTKGSSFTPGAGLGMTLVALLAQEMDAQLHVASECGKGTQITIRVPAERVRRAPLDVDLDGVGDELSVPDTSVRTYFIQPSPKNALISFVLNGLQKLNLTPVPAMADADVVVMDTVDTSAFSLASVDLHPNAKVVLLGSSGMSLPSTARFIGHPMYVMRPPHGPRELQRMTNFILEANARLVHDPVLLSRDSDAVSVASSTATSISPWSVRKRVDTPLSPPTPAGMLVPGVGPGVGAVGNTGLPPPAMHVPESKLGKDDFKVLVVEDNPINMRLLTTIIKRLGFQCAEAVDGADAVSKYISFQPVVVLLDISLPVQDGFEACKQIRESAAQLSLAPMVVAITALSSEQDQQRGLHECGMDVWKTKPVSPRSLSAELQEWFQRWLTQSSVPHARGAGSAPAGDSLLPPTGKDMRKKKTRQPPVLST